MLGGPAYFVSASRPLCFHSISSGPMDEACVRQAPHPSPGCSSRGRASPAPPPAESLVTAQQRIRRKLRADGKRGLHSRPESRLYLGASPGGSGGKESTRQCRRPRFHPCVRKIPWRRRWLPTPEFLPGESYDRRNYWAVVHGATKSLTQLSD